MTGQEAARFITSLAARGYTPQEIVTFGRIHHGLTLDQVQRILASDRAEAKETACRNCKRCSGEGCEWCYR